MQSPRRLVAALMAALIVVSFPLRGMAAAVRGAAADELSSRCVFSADGAHNAYSRLTDGDYRLPFAAAQGGLTVSAPEGASISSLYLCFADAPARFSLQRQTADGWETFWETEASYSHMVAAAPALEAVRIMTAAGEPLSLNELRVFSAGELPADVQQWKPALEKADILLLVAHPDDEFLFFGGLIPWYASQGKSVLVVYMTCRDATRRAELLNGLWAAGQRAYPVIGPFADRSTRTLEKMYAAWTREEVDSFLIKLIRRYRPEVLVTHDLSGEYGHGAHRVCADSALRMFDKAADALYMPQHSKRYGVWQVKKLYLHLYAQNPMRMDWTRDAGGASAAELSRLAFEMHRSQRHFHMQLSAGARYDSSLFGLAKSVVGPDVRKDDFLENANPAP